MTKLNYSKRLPSSFSCAQCRKEERETRKQEIRQAEAEQHAYYAQMQEEMFSKAKEEMEAKMRSQYNADYASAAPCLDENARNQVIEQQINKLALDLTRKYLQEAPEGSNPDRDQVFLVFKFLNTPHEVLVSGLRQMQPS